jgi:hypothetical protein
MGTQPDPELLALSALGFLAETPDALGRFLGQSGTSLAELRARAGDLEFLGGVLDFLLAEDDLAGRFCAAENIAPHALHLARHRLSGNRAE